MSNINLAAVILSAKANLVVDMACFMSSRSSSSSSLGIG